ncbi:MULTISPECIES: hypothetical protein [Cyanophyceae]|uniref:hypothetical protein n=1 Tax=Cyanophyceae TaxID=3028117 RepID=UPI000A0F3C72|nr:MULTISPECIES: hypothetical protein [Cyanophyceae]SMH58429.1 hypothetical protein SAMN06272755_3177 [Picosynechococcus sp. OG1]SMQ86425.1 hypothetical protein SAMN06272774_3169 [Synechococcus sp. 7002]
MSLWTRRQPCPSCDRSGTGRIKCSNCQTVGCTNGNCEIGGLNRWCPICRKETRKIHL